VHLARTLPADERDAPAHRLVNHGSMANALPHAIGAQAAQPGRQVIALSGDGGLAMLLGELLTLRQQRLPVKIVVFNNGALSFVELEMKAAGIPTYGTDLADTDFAGIARSAGLLATRVEEAAELEDALQAALAHDGPALVDVQTARQELSLPPTLTYGQIKGFTLYATRTILSGQGDELIEVARTNLHELEAE
jgi:pyruvate dehydrogenase (quinone)